MLSKKERLSRSEFSRFFSVGRRIHSPFFTLLYSPHETLHASVVVSKKNAKHAVTRNKIRRQIYDMVRRYRSEKKVSGVYIFLTKKSVLHTPYAVLKQEVYTHLDSIQK